MANEFDFDSYVARLSGELPKAIPLPAPTSLPKSSMPALNMQPTPSTQPTVDPTDSYIQSLASEVADKPLHIAKMSGGSAPFNAIPESPLSVIERAQLGWVRTPENQRKILEHNFGKGNVQLIHNNSEGSYVVKDTDGMWKQVDPGMSWHLKDTVRNLKDLPGDISQFIGEYGLRSAVAGAAGAQGAALGAAAGPLGAVAGGIIGSATGAGGSEALDMLSRKLMPNDIIGTDLAPESFEDLQKQIYASMMFGAEQEAGGQLLKFGGKAATNAMANTIKTLSNTPTGRALAAKIIGTISGLGENLARVRVDNPLKTAVYDEIAGKDLVNRTNYLDNLMSTSVENAYNKFVDVKNKVFSPQYAAIKAEAEKLQYNPLEAVNNAFQSLSGDGYLVKGKLPSADAGIVRGIGANEGAAINYVAKMGQKIANQLAEGKSIAYDEMQNVIKTMDNKLYGRDHIIDPRLRNILSQFRADLKNNLRSTSGAEKLQYNPLEAVNNAFQSLSGDGYLVKGKLPSADAGIVRDIGANEGAAINYVAKMGQKIANRLAEGKSIAYDEMQNVIKTMDNKLYGRDHIIDPRLRNILSQFRADLKNNLRSTSGAEKLQYNPLEAVNNALQSLSGDGYLVKGKLPSTDAGIVRDIGANEGAAINYVAKMGQKIANRLAEGKSIAYDEMQNVIKTMDNKLYERDHITDPRLRNILSQFRADLKNNLRSTLGAKNPEAAMKFAELDQKYGPIKELMETLAPLKADQKVDGFLKKVVKDDGSFNSSLMANLAEALGTSDPTESLLQMHVAKKSTSWTSGKKLGGIIPGSPALTSNVVTSLARGKQMAEQFIAPTSQAAQIAKDSVPYLNRSLQLLKTLSPEARKIIFNDPSMINFISNTVSGAVIGEQENKKELLNKAGIQ